LKDINKLLDQEIMSTDAVSDTSFKNIVKYADMLMRNDDKFIAAKRQLFSKVFGEEQ